MDKDAAHGDFAIKSLVSQSTLMLIILTAVCFSLLYINKKATTERAALELTGLIVECSKKVPIEKCKELISE